MQKINGDIIYIRELQEEAEGLKKYIKDAHGLIISLAILIALLSIALFVATNAILTIIK